MTEPFLRWAGGKRWLAQTLRPYFENAAPRRYVEPFLGGGSLFFALGPDMALLSDLNEDLVATYDAVRSDPHRVLQITKQWPHTERQYYAVREANFSDPYESAAQFIYLNRTCWNGLYRVNRNGRFNVPYGKTEGRKLLDEANFLAAAARLRSARLRATDFEDALADVRPGDFVYLDPPYSGLHSDNGFRRYNDTLFSWSDHVRLARVFSELATKGVFVVLSNAAHADVLDLYKEFAVVHLTRASRIAGSAAYRRQAKEILVLSDTAAKGVIV